MRTMPLLSLVAALTAFGLVGCDNDSATSVSTGTTSTDEQALGLLISEDLDHFGLDVEMGNDEIQVTDTDGRLGPQGAPIESFYFARLIRSQDVTRDIHIENPAGEPATAEVTVVRDLHGIFRLFVDDPDRYLPATIDKRLEATATRNAKFVRRDGHPRHRGWRLVEVSGVEIASDPASTMIQSIELSSASVNVIITDPLELEPLRELPAFLPNEEVTVTVTTGDESDYVFLHTRGGKREFDRLGSGVFQGTWTTGGDGGVRRAAVDVIAEDSLFDDEAPYDSVIWGFVYRIVRPDEPPIAGDDPSSGSDG
jgi:hypothetical protein